MDIFDKKETEKKVLLSASVQEKMDQSEKFSKFMELKNQGLKRSPSCSLIIVDDFYNNPMDTRNYILSQEFEVKGNYPGQRTISYASEELKEIIQNMKKLVRRD